MCLAEIKRLYLLRAVALYGKRREETRSITASNNKHMPALC